eukprot:TRINITY_DN7124_c0_g2_i1.p1 TRINITY_DN7124_c0_g2~~TRINITY_DN7124_c0_g2_i1.p1  ORF type:complete len:891 (-),score=162.05 TRINITY_DN7124_c0_g2_i1:120-2744(-)
MAPPLSASLNVFPTKHAAAASPSRGGRRTVPATAFANKSANLSGGNSQTILMSPPRNAGHRDIQSPHRATVSTQRVQRRQPSVPPIGQALATSPAFVAPGKQPQPPCQSEPQTARRWPDYAAGTTGSGYSTPVGTPNARLAHSPLRARLPAYAGHPSAQALLAAAAVSQQDARLRSPGRPNATVGENAGCAVAASPVHSSTVRGTGSYTPASTSYNPPTASQKGGGIGSFHVSVPRSISSIKQGPTTMNLCSPTRTPQVPSKPVCLTSAATAALAAANTSAATKSMSSLHKHRSITPPSTSATSLASLVATPTVSTEPTPTGGAGLTSGFAPKTSLALPLGSSGYHGQPPPIASGVQHGALAASLATASLPAEEDAMFGGGTPVPIRMSYQMLTGACSTGSIRMCSPLRGVDSRSSPVQVVQTIHYNSGEGRREVMTPSRLAQISRSPEVDKLDLDSLNENFRDVQMKVQSIHSILNEPSAQNALEKQLEQARDAERAALKAERERNDQLAETSRQLHEVTLRLNEAEAQLWLAHEEAATNEQSRIDLQRAAAQEQERIVEQDRAHLERTRTELHEARRQLESKDTRIQEMQRVLGAAEKSRTEAETAADSEVQMLQLQKQLQLKLDEINELRLRCSRDADTVEILKRDNRDLCKGMKDVEDELLRIKEATKEQQAILGERELQLRQREHDVAAQEQNIFRVEQLDLALQQERVDFEAQRQETQDQLERQRKELMRQAEEQQQLHRRFSNAEKENRPLRQTVQQQKKWLWDLEGQLNKERVVTNFLTPGEYAKMVRTHQREHDFPQQVVDLKAKNMNLELETAKLHKLNEIYRRHMPNDAMDRAVAEVQAAMPSSTDHEAGAFSEPEEEEPNPA